MENLDQITTILEEYHSGSLFCLDIRRQLIADALPGDVPGSVSEMQCDESVLRRLEADLGKYQSYLSAVEFNWIEAAAKEMFITQALMTEDAPLTTDADVQRLSSLNLECEKQLQELQALIDRDEAEVLAMTEELEAGYDLTIKTCTQARKLTNEIADLELELNELKLNQTEDDADRMTITEVTQMATEYENQLQEMNKRLAANQSEVPRLKTLHSKETKVVEQLRAERHTLEKAEGDRRRTLTSQIRGGTLVKIEAGRTWLKSVRRTYEASLGISAIYFFGPTRSRPNKFHIKFTLRHPLEGTLVVNFKDSPLSGTRYISSAYLDQSSQDVEPIVKPFIAESDLTSLIGAVIHFLGQL
ncbi:hypothetical protein CROQUDRAFT_662420 [Cronartium quercuum f. sp. fusiforme G11]|uniref:Kinetochore protein SPC25 n=1 Tax=Cronartium quercuum f. sp. fusiforme G11 TaxID=708437 RepID=A0A9P6NAU6_9BASI|nr:hypothetical protein CROQUDRAFT_662420 [Cronartium quercuum f. sp. fusiforme G11]